MPLKQARVRTIDMCYTHISVHGPLMFMPVQRGVVWL
jgi:hypothetical protein